MIYYEVVKEINRNCCLKVVSEVDLLKSFYPSQSEEVEIS